MNFVNKIVDKSEALFSNATSGFNKLMRLIPSASGSILYNKWVLYFIAIISLVDMTRFYMYGNTNAVMLFFAVGLLTTFFSKNMTVVLVIALALTHLVTFGTKSLEGLDNQEEEDTADDEEEEVAEEEDVAEEEVAEEEEAMTDKKDKDSFESIAETAKTVSLLSKDAKDLPTQTVELLNKQKELMANMTQLQPLLKKAEELVKTESFATMSRGPVYAEYK